jgi:5-(carboxyamino)imidazole ribonucleotide synthase
LEVSFREVISKSKTTTQPNIRFGILGGGQLARLLALAAHDLGLQVHVLCANADEPAAQVVRHCHIGSTDRVSDIQKFLKQVDIVTFESEFLNAELLERLSKKTRVPIFPAPKLMGELQDRLSQKRLLLHHGLPSAPFFEVSSHNTQESDTTLSDALRTWGGLVFKKRRFGYDGYGTFIVKTARELEKVRPLLQSEKSGFIVEKWIPFQREIAVILTRSRDGSVACFPWVETHQQNSRCLWVKGPLKIKGIDKTEKKLKKFLNKIDYVGSIGFELFENTDGSVLINELAPRVHNSGHYSIEALLESQFTLHIKAVLGQKLQSPGLISRTKAFAMYNLLGTGSEPAQWSEVPPGVFVHWYQKTEVRSGRKMGHLTALASKPDQALDRLKKARKKFDV